MENKTASNYNDLPLKAPKLKGILLILILVMGIYVAYTGLIKRETTKAVHAVINFLVVFILSASFIAYAQNKILFLVLTCIVFFVAIIYLFIKAPATVYYRPLLYTAAIVFAGAMGNFIDRVFRGYVVDFIYFSLIDFPTFNVADIYVTCGITVMVFLMFFRYKEENDFDFLKPGNRSAR